MSEAIQWTGQNIHLIKQFMDPIEPIYMTGFVDRDEIVGVPTAEGVKVAHIGDILVKTDEGLVVMKEVSDEN